MGWFARIGLVLAFVLGTIGDARAEAERSVASEDVTVLTPPPVPSYGSPSATIDPAPDLARFIGQPIGSVDVVLDDTRWPDVRAPVISVMRAGDRVSPALARRAMDEALASGHFADARVTFATSAAGVIATIHVMPRKVIDSVRLAMPRANADSAQVDTDQLIRDAELAPDGELVAGDIPKRRAHLESQLQRRGFSAPVVAITTRETGDPLRVVVVLQIDLGAPRRIERTVLYPIGASPEEAADARRSYAVKTGDRADESALDVADAALQARLRGRGWHRAEVSHDVVLHRGLIVLRTRIDFGMRFETRYEGNDHYDKDTLDSVLELETETDRTPNHLLQKIRDYYVKHGFLDVDVRLETRGTPSDSVNYLVFHVGEHERVSLAGREYPCLREADVKTLDEGGPRSAAAIGSEIDSYLEEELPGGDVLVPPRADGLDATIAGPGQRGSRPAPVALDPDNTFVSETYERAVQHVQELYRSEGFLSAAVGPVQMLRRRCDPRSPPGACVPISTRSRPPDVCTYDASGLPLPVPPLEPGSTCVPEPARGITCEPRVRLRIPVKLGPRTQLYDLAFSGATALSPAVLAKAAIAPSATEERRPFDMRLGQYVSTIKIDEARRKLADAYKEEGYAFVDVKYALELSPDRTRARVRFIIAEGEQVFVRQIVIKGNVDTKSEVIARRVALTVGQLYRTSAIRKSEERIATLGAFASVSIALEDPYVPERNKTVLVTVVERPPQSFDLLAGFSTGEGFRLAPGYGHTNLWGSAVQLTLRLHMSYIPTQLIIDPTARDNYRGLPAIARLGMRATGGLTFPDVGLGPLVRAGIDAIGAHDLQRDFYITKVAAIPNVSYRPTRQLQFTLSQSVEVNNSRIFQQETAFDYFQRLRSQNISTTAIAQQLNVPSGESYAFAQRILATWDRRDAAFDATRGTFLASSVEHVDGFPFGSSTTDPRAQVFNPPVPSHFFKFVQDFRGYIPLPLRGWRIASETRIGVNVQLTSTSLTYPDRRFFMGGADTMRGWNLNTFVPQDSVDHIFADQQKPDLVASSDPQNAGAQVRNPDKFTLDTIPVRAGNLSALQRVELRIPIRGIFETVAFFEAGNLWNDPSYPFNKRRFPLRTDAGSGLRIKTPIGPIAADVGFNLNREVYEDPFAINLAIGLF